MPIQHTLFQDIQRQIDQLGYLGHADLASGLIQPGQEWHAPIPVRQEHEWYHGSMFISEDRLQRYADFEDMDLHPFTSAIFDIYAEQAAQPDPWGNVMQIVTPDRAIKDELTELFFDRLNVNQTLYDDVRNTVKMGDHFKFLVLQRDRRGVLFAKDIPAYTVWRLEWEGKLFGFVQYTPGGQTPVLDPFSVVHFKVAGAKTKYLPYGTAILDSARRHYRQLKLMEDAMVVYRITRAPERRVFFINTARVPPAKAEGYIQQVMHRFRKKSFINPLTGDVDWRANPLSPDEDFFVPIRDGQEGTRIEQLPGAQNLCLALDTNILLLDGRTIPLSQAIVEYESGKENWVYSVNPKTSEVVPGPITWAGITRKDAQVMRLTLDNGESVICTPDHKFPTRLRGEVQAQELIVGDSMIPFERRIKSIAKKKGKSEYEQIFSDGKWEFTHKIVSNYMKSLNRHEEIIYDKKFSNYKKSTIHHKNFKHFDNNPSNLAFMANADHFKFHSENMKEFHANVDKEWFGRQISNGICKADSDPKKKELRLSRIKNNSMKGSQARQQRQKNDPQFKKEVYEKSGHGIRIALRKKRENPSEWSKLIEHCRSISPGFGNATTSFNKAMVDIAVETYKKCPVNEANAQIWLLRQLNLNQEFMSYFKELNAHSTNANNKIKANAFKVQHLIKMLKFFGYKSFGRFRKEHGYITNGESAGVQFDQFLWDKLIKYLNDGIYSMTMMIAKLNSDTEFLAHFFKINELQRTHNFLRTNQFGETLFYIMLKRFGFNGWQSFKENLKCANHRIAKIEWLDKRQDTGTITVDGNEIYHNFHNFSLSAGIYTKNSEVDDVKWFKDQILSIAKIPRVYLNDSDGGSAERRENLSQQDVRFAISNMRIQGQILEGYTKLAIVHLLLRGYEKDRALNFRLELTNPSHAFEKAEIEVEQQRIGLLRDYTDAGMPRTWVWEKILHLTPSEIKRMIKRRHMENLLITHQEAEVEAYRDAVTQRITAELTKGLPPTGFGEEGEPMEKLAPEAGAAPGGMPGAAPGGAPPPGGGQPALPGTSKEELEQEKGKVEKQKIQLEKDKLRQQREQLQKQRQTASGGGGGSGGGGTFSAASNSNPPPKGVREEHERLISEDTAQALTEQREELEGALEQLMEEDGLNSSDDGRYDFNDQWGVTLREDKARRSRGATFRGALLTVAQNEFAPIILPGANERNGQRSQAVKLFEMKQQRLLAEWKQTEEVEEESEEPEDGPIV